MSYEIFRPQDVVIIFAIACFGGLIIAAHLSVRQKELVMSTIKNRIKGNQTM